MAALVKGLKMPVRVQSPSDVQPLLAMHGRLSDPFVRLLVKNIHKDKHGSDTGTHDGEGRFVTQKFEDMVTKQVDGKDSLKFWEAPT